MVLLSQDGRQPKQGEVFSIVLSLISMAILAVCLSRRVQNVKKWSALPINCWAILLIYADSIAFVLATAIISNGFGVDTSKSICEKVILLCLTFYMTTKILIYFFLVERAYIIRRSPKPRMRDSLYLFNSFGMLVPYAVVIALNFIFRFATYEDGMCRIGMKRVAMIPLIAFDVLVNVYLTTLFLVPLRGLLSYRTDPHSQTRTLALRTFIGSCCTLTSSVANLTVVMALDGEPGWICLMCCNIDILFSVLVLHWCTSKDNASTLCPTTLPSPSPSVMLLGSRQLIPRNARGENSALYRPSQTGSERESFLFRDCEKDGAEVGVNVGAGVDVDALLQVPEKIKEKDILCCS